MTYETIRADIQPDRVATLVLSRASKRNAISIAMRREISACLSSWRDDGAVGVVVLSGEGVAFSAGFDLEEFKQPERYQELFETSARYHRDVWRFPKPIIAAVNGPAMGGGFDLATLCDMRVGSTRAYFGHPEIKFGAPPLYTPLRWIIGEGIARELCLTGRGIDAAEAHRIGLLTEVVDGSRDVVERAVGLARQILEAPLQALRFTKHYFVANAGKGFEEAFQLEHDRAFEEILLPAMRARV
ncbi:MAG TPA: enoyl-CoA hydratase/isomerase family protein [Myxococcaceae bacterium]|nr:enoyl-CoA hydratase/isomerase family protein [Myxococcaceae bacterium]